MGTLKRTYGHQRVRSGSLARTATAIWFMLLAYNLHRADRVLADSPRTAPGAWRPHPGATAGQQPSVGSV